jgi:signal transduction histidine kinase
MKKMTVLQTSFVRSIPGTAGAVSLAAPLSGVPTATSTPVPIQGDLVATAKPPEDKAQHWDDRALLEQLARTVSERDQRRIGEHLREDLCQRLAGIEAASKALEQWLKTKAPPKAGLVSLAREIAAEMHESLRQARRLADELQPVSSLDQGLLAAIQELVANTEQRSGIDCRFEGQDLPDIQDTVLATHLYRIAQEALSNAAQHAQAKIINVRLSLGGRQIVLAIADNGVGLPPNAAHAPGIGLRIMRFRSDVIGADLDVQSLPGKGTVVTCRCPVKSKGSVRQFCNSGTD